jgi:hypothetical protein
MLLNKLLIFMKTNDSILAIQKALTSLNNDLKDKKSEQENVSWIIFNIKAKASMKIQKKEYNKELKEYNNILKIISNNESKVETLENKICKYSRNQKTLNIDDNFAKHFCFVVTVNRTEITDHILDLLGLSFCNPAFIQVNYIFFIKKFYSNEFELKGLFNSIDITLDLLSNSINESKEFQTVQDKLNIVGSSETLKYPLDLIYEFLNQQNQIRILNHELELAKEALNQVKKY